MKYKFDDTTIELLVVFLAISFLRISNSYRSYVPGVHSIPLCTIHVVLLDSYCSDIHHCKNKISSIHSSHPCIQFAPYCSSSGYAALSSSLIINRPKLVASSTSTSTKYRSKADRVLRSQARTTSDGSMGTMLSCAMSGIKSWSHSGIKHEYAGVREGTKNIHLDRPSDEKV
jgi:hypothetical protein